MDKLLRDVETAGAVGGAAGVKPGAVELIAGPTPGRVTITITAPTSKGHAPATYTAHVNPAT